MDQAKAVAPKYTFWGLALVALATLMLQVSLTRIFSVTMWYHMALVSVSMAMFGMTLGALIVHWLPNSFTRELAPSKCAIYSLAFSLSTAVSLAVCLHTPFKIEMSSSGIVRILFWNSVAAIPFVFSGVCVCICLTRYTRHVGRLYSFDLAGASLGCLLTVVLLGYMDAISAILLIAAVPALGAIAFALDGQHKKLAAAALVSTICLTAGALHNSKNHWLNIEYVLGQPYDTETLLHEEWNVFSYITVSSYNKLIFWGAGSKARPEDVKTESVFLAMDTRAATPIVKFENNWDDVAWLLYDATNLVHGLRTDGDVLVIGAGGGRDILSSQIPSRGKRTVTGLEINPITIDLHNKKFREYSRIADLDGVTLINDEARSWVARCQQKFQVITIPLVDTSAASAAGAFALTENSLYTTEAFNLFYSKLTDDGVLSVSRSWHGGNIGEAHRLVVMAAASLRQSGAKNPRGHLYLGLGGALVTLLVSKEPYTEEDLARLAGVCEKYGFEPLLTPKSHMDPRLAAAAEDPSWAVQAGQGDIKFSIDASTDDKPYFFHSYSLQNLLSAESWTKEQQTGVNSWDREAMLVLATLLVAVTLLCVACGIVPFLFERGAERLSGLQSFATLGFFGLIGFGFMLFESAQMQRFSVFLGYPIYALTVVLFALLLSSSMGAATIGRIPEEKTSGAVVKIGLALLTVLLVIGLLTPLALTWLAASSTPYRILVSILLIAPAGFFLGMLFPLGMRLSASSGQVSLAWCWALNGVASTCAAVYSIALSISFGIAFTYWAGFVCYIVACYCCYLMSRPSR